jgi:hypothetical protein
MLQDCCLAYDGQLRKIVPSLLPPAPHSGHSQDGCYLAGGANCSVGLSAEHYFSRALLQIIGESTVFIAGTPWVPPGTTRAVGISSLTAKILCGRHNSALSVLDQSATKLFQSLQTIMDDINLRSLSRRDRYYFFSGEELELWMLKVLCGTFYSKNAASQRISLFADHSLDSEVVRGAFEAGRWPQRCGLYLNAGMNLGTLRYNALSFTCLTSVADKKVTGCRVGFAGIEFDLFIDPTAVIAEAPSYRPSYLVFDDSRKRHIVKLTWPEGTLNQTATFHSRPGPRPKHSKA